MSTVTPAESVGANVADLLRRAGEEFADRIALLTGAGTRTWSELDAATDAGAAELTGLGLAAGDRIVIALPTGGELAVVLFAALRAGLIVVPVAPSGTDLAWVGRRVGAAAAITEHRDVPVSSPARVSGSAAMSAPTVVDSESVRRWWTQAAPRAVPGAGGEDIAMLARSTRSGPPVMLSHRALLGGVAALTAAPRMDLHASDRVLQVLPLYHVVGFVTAFLPAARVGAAVVMPDAPDTTQTAAEAALAAIRAHRATVIPGEATWYRQLHRTGGFDRALASVRLMTSGSSPLDPADFAATRTATGMAVREGYGISESAAVVASTLMTGSAHPGSVGLPLPGVEVRIVGPDGADVHAAHGPTAADDPDYEDSGPLAEVAGEGEMGRITIRGNTLFSGYWPDGADGPGDDGWFATGDLGYFDDAGELHLVDRFAETVTVAGFTVYPREVEDVLVGHPFVADAAVVGVPGRGGVDVVAVLVARPGTHPTAADLDDYLADKLAPFKLPRAFQLVEVLPRTEVGRLDRDAVRTEYARRAGIALNVREPLVPGNPVGVGRGAADRADTAPEAAAGLDELGRRLPGAGRRGRRSAQDSDDDLF